MTNWNYADVWEAIADAQPEAVAVSQGPRMVSWQELDRKAAGVAERLLEIGCARQSKIGIYLYNSPEYLESVFAAFKVGLVPINTNYRYVEDELVYLWNNADTVAVVFHGSFADTIEHVRSRLPTILGWLWVDDGSGPCPDWAISFEDAARSGISHAVVAPWGRSGDDQLILYTGGTTGKPKGVVWRQDDLFARLNSALSLRRFPEDASIDDVYRIVDEQGPGRSQLPACPLMHGTGGFTGLTALADGGQAVLLSSRKYDPSELLDTITHYQVYSLTIVGDSFALPLLDALESQPGHWDLSSLARIVSSGAMWSEEVKRKLLLQHDQLVLVDGFSSSEAIGLGGSVSTRKTTKGTGAFTLGRDVSVIREDGRVIRPGSEEIGLVALSGRMPIQYYKDEAKSASTFKLIDGVRYSIPGDYARVNGDGSIQLLGRGSMCINSGGEKVFPEEVEEVIKTHPSVRDAVVVGVPHATFGEQVVAEVEINPRSDVEEIEIIAYAKRHLAAYKAPRRVRIVEAVIRAPSGKLDYQRVRREFIRWLGTEAPVSGSEDER